MQFKYDIAKSAESSRSGKPIQPKVYTPHYSVNILPKYQGSKLFNIRRAGKCYLSLSLGFCIAMHDLSGYFMFGLGVVTFYLRGGGPSVYCFALVLPILPCRFLLANIIT